jgi:hypothetical protein
MSRHTAGGQEYRLCLVLERHAGIYWGRRASFIGSPLEIPYFNFKLSADMP